MANLFDELQMGTVSRRRLFERLAITGGSAALASAQTPPDSPKLSPANIGGGGRIERDFYRQWLKNSKLPTVEGYDAESKQYAMVPRSRRRRRAAPPSCLQYRC